MLILLLHAHANHFAACASCQYRGLHLVARTLGPFYRVTIRDRDADGQVMMGLLSDWVDAGWLPDQLMLGGCLIR
jgi:hypothetical protein